MAIWSHQPLQVFDRDISLTQNVVMTQGCQALAAMILRIDRLYELLGSTPQLIDSYIHQEIPYVLTEICAHQGVASNILFNCSPRASDESARAYGLRIERYEYVKRFCDADGLDLTILTSRTVRNQLMHIDSYIEKAMRTPNTGWFIDSAIAF